MKLSMLEIDGFRGISKAKVLFQEHTVLIGSNSIGKTSLVEAIALIFGRDRMVRSLTEHDFFGSRPERLSRIKIRATLTGFEPEDISVHTDWFRRERGTPVWLDFGTGEVYGEKIKDDVLLSCQIEFAARFDQESLEVDTARYFTDGMHGDVFDDEVYSSVPGSLTRDIGFFVVPANRTWDRMISFNSELFRRVIGSTNGLPAETILAERDRIRDPAEKLEEDKAIAPIIAEVNREIEEVFANSTELSLRLTTTDSTGVLEAVIPHFKAKGGNAVPAKKEGSGLISLQSLFLLLHFGQKRIKEGENFFLVLEEPELHLPPAVQRRVLSRLQALSTQTIITTHSPLVAGYCDAKSLMVLENNAGELAAKPLLIGSLANTENAVRKLYQIQRVDTAAALMSETVLVPEGQYDFDWLTLLSRVAELADDKTQKCNFGVRVGVVPTNSSKVVSTCLALSQCHSRISAMVDGDIPGLAYADEIDANFPDVQAVVRWPNGWAIEDFVGWIISADPASILTNINEDFDPFCQNAADLVARLKTKNRLLNGLKGDRVAYETIANAISENPSGSRRCRFALHCLADACVGLPSELFWVQVEREGLPKRMVFTP